MKKVNEIKETVVTQEVTQESVVLIPEISKELDVMINDIFVKQLDLDNSKINLYVYMIEMFKLSTHKNRLTEVLLNKIHEQGKVNNVSKAYVNKVKNIVKISGFSVIYDLYLFEGRSTNVKAYFYNIEKLVRLFDYLHTNYTKEEVEIVRKELNKLIKIVDKKEYNDALAKALTDLFKKYKIVLDDSGAIIKVALTSEGIKSFLTALTSEQLEMVIKQANKLAKQNKAK